MLSMAHQTHMLFSFRETVSSDFMAACQFLNEHMENMDNPNDDMVRNMGLSHRDI